MMETVKFKDLDPGKHFIYNCVHWYKHQPETITKNAEPLTVNASFLASPPGVLESAHFGPDVKVKVQPKFKANWV